MPRTTVPRMTVSPVLSVAAIAGGLIGVALILFARWIQPLAEGAEAARAGDFDRALQQYAIVEERFERVPLARQILRTAYGASVANQLQVHYYLGNYDTVIDKAASSVSTGRLHFWAGCALFEKGRAAEKREERVTWLNRAEEQFRKALEEHADDWDSKFNYELTSQLLAELREPRKPPPRQLLPLLRPQPVMVNRPDRRIG